MAQRGPGTARGKAASSHNAVKHGLRSDAPVIPEFESFDEWESFRDGIVAGYQPEGRLETELAGRSALLLWRLKRVVRYETEMTAHYLDDIPEDMAKAAGYAERALKIPLEVTITQDAVDKQFSRRLLPSEQTLERIMRGACPERSRPQAAVAEGRPTSTASGSRPSTSSRRSRPAARAATLRWGEWSLS